VKLEVKASSAGGFDPEVFARAVHPNPPPLHDSSAQGVVSALSPSLDSDEVLSFERLLPTPDHLVEAGWRDWRLENWGTKWDAHDTSVLDRGGWLEYWFLTAWSPPEAWLEALAAAHPECNFTMVFAEEANQFAGVMTVEDGVVDVVEFEEGHEREQLAEFDMDHCWGSDEDDHDDI
jgi:hypothetical protein